MEVTRFIWLLSYRNDKSSWIIPRKSPIFAISCLRKLTPLIASLTESLNDIFWKWYHASWQCTELLKRIEETYTPPSPVTNSPLLKLCLGDRFRFIKLLNFSKPSRNNWFTWLFFWFRLFIVSASAVGGGNENASKPGKKRKMLSDTCWPRWIAAAESGSLKTYIEEKNTLVTFLGHFVMPFIKVTYTYWG